MTFQPAPTPVTDDDYATLGLADLADKLAALHDLGKRSDPVERLRWFLIATFRAFAAADDRPAAIDELERHAVALAFVAEKLAANR